MDDLLVSVYDKSNERYEEIKKTPGVGQEDIKGMPLDGFGIVDDYGDNLLDDQAIRDLIAHIESQSKQSFPPQYQESKWNRQIAQGEKNITDLASDYKVSRTYISRMLNLMLLAPDIVEAILSGKQPKSLRLKDLMQPMPYDWDEQRKLLCSIT